MCTDTHTRTDRENLYSQQATVCSANTWWPACSFSSSVPLLKLPLKWSKITQAARYYVFAKEKIHPAGCRVCKQWGDREWYIGRLLKSSGPTCKPGGLTGLKCILLFAVIPPFWYIILSHFSLHSADAQCA